MNPEEQKQAIMDDQADNPKRWADCPTQWGNCDERNPTYFGKPTDTPHSCKGGRKHGSKLHACAKCGCVGAVHAPLAWTKAGKQLRTLVLAEARYQAMQKAKIYLESRVKIAESTQLPKEITSEG